MVLQPLVMSARCADSPIWCMSDLHTRFSVYAAWSNSLGGTGHPLYRISEVWAWGGVPLPSGRQGGTMENRSPLAESASEERRVLTIMFGDMVDSTSIGETLGPDSMHELIKRYQSACTQTLIDNDGVVERWMGDGFMAYFGYPSKHEDAALRAVEAGLAVSEVM